jgi:hypothetical protein
VDFLGWLSFDAFVAETTTWTCAVALRDPVYRGMSAALVRMLALGLPLVISDVEEWVWPSRMDVLAIPVCVEGVSEPTLLAAALLRLRKEPGLLDELARRARAAWRRDHTIDAMLCDYLESPQ